MRMVGLMTLIADMALGLCEILWLLAKECEINYL